MKNKVIVISNIKLKLVLLITIIIFLTFINLKKDKRVAVIKEENVLDNTIKEVINQNIKIEYKEKIIDFPKEIDGVEVIGKLEIPKINLTTYILVETNKINLNKSVTRLCGPNVNGVGNLCITGHNYHNSKMFGNLKKLKKEDKFKITDIKGNIIEYQIYNIYEVYPNEIECLSQETGGEREVTLITCTTGAIKRLIVKAIEIYD